MLYKYDVFLNHNSKDKPAVKAIAEKLIEKHHLKCWLDTWNLVPGEPWQEALEEALDQCETVAVFVGSNNISPWQNVEMRSALGENTYYKARRVIPVLLPSAPDIQVLKLPRFLSQLTWVDFREGLQNEDALYRLYCGIKGIGPGPDEGKVGGIPPGSYLPFARNALFTGREDILTSLAGDLLDSMSNDNLAIPQAVTGMGGLGKTQMAVEFAHRYGSCFRGVHWLDLRDLDALDGAIALCGIKMGYTQTDQSELVAATMKTWIQDGPRLLLLDNFEDVSRATEVLARFQYSSLRLLITSRRKDFPKPLGLHVRELGLFTEIESSDFLAKTLEQMETYEERVRLAKRLGYLPLALEMAAHYININVMGVKAYLTELEDILNHESMQAEWFQDLDIENSTRHDHSMLGTFQISWREIKDETQQKIFMISGYLAPNTPIPLEIFKEALGPDDKALFKAMYRLDSMGLLPVANKSASIHPLLAAYARLLVQSSSELLEKLVNKMTRLAGRANRDVDKSGNLDWFVPLLPHVVAVAGYAQAAGIQNAAYLLNSLGYYLNKIADYRGAQTNLPLLSSLEMKMSWIPVLTGLAIPGPGSKSAVP